MTVDMIEPLSAKFAQAGTVRLFLDYDGTLDAFAPTPDIILPNQQVIDLLERLVKAQGILPAVISGRKLQHIKELLPVPGLLLAGTYGLEMRLPSGQELTRLSYDQIRPTIELLLPRWRAISSANPDFYLEDKGWSLALHGKNASHTRQQEVMTQARQQAADLLNGSDFRLEGNLEFLEYSPQLANKFFAVEYIVQKLTPQDAVIIFIGDDDKDEKVFARLGELGGYGVRVSKVPVDTKAQYRLENPVRVREWLTLLLERRDSFLE
jgi:trehalose 6-phosphate phosphatase